MHSAYLHREAKKKMSSPTLSTIKRLFAVSGNECAYPGCSLPLVEASGTVTGEVAHIKASSKNGPRYDDNQIEEERNSFRNLILLCSRHHTIIDSEVDEHTVEVLKRFNVDHEQERTVEITPYTATVAKVLLQNYQDIIINNNTGQVAVNSPGAVQAKTVNIKSQKQKVTVSPPEGSVSSNLEMRSYIEYLIAKYQDYQKQDTFKVGRYKYMALYNAIKREHGSKWQLVPSSSFESLVTFIQNKVDYTKVGRIRKKRDQKRYHSFSEHLEIINA